ncbi:response regulator transcription factor [Actinoplanes sp. RD1]|uniref:response regulator transcription factor n=1 Tax=Actinoplanes sp. RD1 TaxID=3064538 RepID=UPI002740F660|nr:helix-turn-helix transcriptional regulator [Actinoplanes sp. RD1]
MARGYPARLHLIAPEEGQAVTDALAVALDLAAEINRVTPGGDPARDLAFVWDPMRRLVPFAARWVGTLDEDHRCYSTVASAGHDAGGRAYMGSEELTDLRKNFGLLRRRRPLRLQDAPPHTVELPCWAERWWPAGLREAVAAPLVTPDGRHLGVLVLHTDTAEQPTADARDALEVVTYAIAAVLDPMNSLTGLARLVQDATAAVTVDRRGVLAPLPGMPPDRLLIDRPDIVTTAVDGLTDEVRHTSFLSPVPADGGRQRYVRVTGLACPPGMPDDLAGLVVTSPPGELHHLTLRELVVLGLVIEGYPNQGIASRLSITARTAAAHLEHIRAKLRAPTRTAAAVLAMRSGLYIPYRLMTTAPSSSPG